MKSKRENEAWFEEKNPLNYFTVEEIKKCQNDFKDLTQEEKAVDLQFVVFKVLNKFVGHSNVCEQTLYEINRELTKAVADYFYKFDIRGDIKFQIKQDTYPAKLDIYPGNMFTLLLMNGVVVPFTLVDGKDNYEYNGVNYELKKNRLAAHLDNEIFVTSVLQVNEDANGRSK